MPTHFFNRRGLQVSLTISKSTHCQYGAFK